MYANEYICTSEISLAILFICLGLVCAKRYCDLQHNTPSSTSYRLTDTPFLHKWAWLLLGLEQCFQTILGVFNIKQWLPTPQQPLFVHSNLLYWQFKFGMTHTTININQLVDYVRTTRLTYLFSFVIIVIFKIKNHKIHDCGVFIVEILLAICFLCWLSCGVAVGSEPFEVAAALSVTWLFAQALLQVE